MAATLDTPLARLLHARGLVPLEPLRQALFDARAERPDGATLAPRLVARGLLAPRLAEALLRELEAEPPGAAGPASAATLRADAVTRREPAPPPALPGGDRWVPGALAGEYRLVRRLGAGGMGTVYEAEHLPTGARRALKALPAAAEPELLLRFQREAELLARVDGHPNVVRIHAAFQALGAQVLAMDLLPGGDLMARLARGPLAPDDAVELGVALARGLEHLHRHGVLHRDLKPHNVMFDERGAPRLVDFGLADAANALSLTGSGVILGTPAYMAPEQARGERGAVGRAADVYGLSALLFHALTGRPPFTGASPLHILAQVHADLPPSPSSLAPAVPPALDAALLRGLAKAPAARFPTAAALGDALAASLADDPDEGRERRVRRASLAALPLAALALLAALLVTPPGSSPAPSPEGPTADAPAPPPSGPPLAASPIALPDPGAPWRLRWSLADGPPPARLPASLWLDDACAGPLEAIASRRRGALEEAFEGTVTAQGERVRVAYGPAALRWRSHEHGAWSLVGPRPAGLEVTTTAREATAVAPDDHGGLLLQVGAARWRDPRAEVRVHVRPPAGPLANELSLLVGGDDVAEARVGLRLQGRKQLAWVSASYRPFDLGASPRRLALEPGAPGPRVLVDDQPLEGLDRLLDDRPPPGAVELLLLESTATLDQLAVEGLPLATDRAARATPPPAGAALVRVCAGFRVAGRLDPPTAEGGPFVALGEGDGELRLELRGWRVVLTQGQHPIASVAVLDSARPAPSLEGWLALERSADRLRATGQVAGEPVAVTLLAPAPLAAPGAPSFGSSGVTARFAAVEVHVAPPDEARERFDAAPPRASDDPPPIVPGGGRAAWRDGAARLREALGRRTTMARAAAAPEGDAAAGRALVAAARRAAQVLEGAVDAGGLAEDEARDALARAFLAWLLAESLEGARRPLDRLVERAGREDARAAIEALSRRRGRPDFVAQLVEGLQPFGVRAPARRAALEAARLVAPEQAGRVLARLAAEAAQQREAREDAVALYRRALEAGAGPLDADAPLARLLVDLGRGQEAVPHLERALARLPVEHDLRVVLCDLLEERGEPWRAIEPALVAYVHQAAGDGDQERLLRLAEQVRDRAPGLHAAALRALALKSGLTLEHPPWPADLPGGARERNLWAWAHGRPPPRDGDDDMPTFLLALDAAGREVPGARRFQATMAKLHDDPLTSALRLIDARIRTKAGPR